MFRNIKEIKYIYETNKILSESEKEYEEYLKSVSMPKEDETWFPNMFQYEDISNSKTSEEKLTKLIKYKLQSSNKKVNYISIELIKTICNLDEIISILDNCMINNNIYYEININSLALSYIKFWRIKDDE